MADFAAPFFAKVAGALAVELAKYGIKYLIEQGPVSKAIQRTADHFSDKEGVAEALKKLSEHPSFSRHIERLDGPGGLLSNDELANLFINDCGFFAGGDTEADALLILRRFAQDIWESLVVDKDGHALLSRQMERGFDDMMRGIESLNLQQPRRNFQVEPSDMTPQVETALKEKALHAKIDVARELLQKGLALSARDIFLRIRREAEDSGAPPKVYYRLSTNIGACALAVGNLDTARAEFQNAFEREPDNPLSLANLAQIRLIDKDAPAALELCQSALAIEAENSNAAAIMIQSYAFLNDFHLIDQLIRDKPWVTGNGICLASLGDVYLKRGDPCKAEQSLRAAIAAGDAPVTAYELLALSVLTPVQERLKKSPPLFGKIPPEATAKFREAESFLETAVRLTAAYEKNAVVATARLNLAVVQILLGRPGEALRNIDAYLEAYPLNPTALENKGRLLLSMDRNDEAIDILERALSVSGGSAIAELLGFAYLKAHAHSKAKELFAALWAQRAGAKMDFAIADMLLHCCHTLGDRSTIDAVQASLMSEYAEDPGALSVIANQCSRDKKVDEAIEYLVKAVSVAEGDQKDWLTRDLAILYSRNDRYAEAARVYGDIANLISGTPEMASYVYVLYRAGNYSEALALARSERTQNNLKPLPFITEIEAWILQYMDDLAAADGLYAALAEIEPKKVSHVIQRVYIALRGAEEPRARELFGGIRAEDISGDPDLLMRAAQLRAYFGEDGSIQLAYQAILLDPINPWLMSGYVALMIGLKESDVTALAPIEVSLDTEVVVQRVEVDEQGNVLTYEPGDTREILIVSDADAAKEIGAIAPSVPLCQELLGKKVKDLVRLKGDDDGETFEIREIKSKYVRKFQQIVKEFGVLFPENPAMRVVEVRSDDASNILSIIDRVHAGAANALELYRSGKITIGGLSVLLGRGMVEVVFGLTSASEGQLWVADGQQQTFAAENRLLRDAREIVLDTTAVLTLLQLGLLCKLRQRFSQVCVPQAVFEDINHALVLRKVGPPATVSIGKQSDHYVRSEISPEATAQYVAFLERAVAEIKNCTDIAPSPAVHIYGKGKLEELSSALTAGAVAAIAAAKEKSVPLYSDDLILRKYAKGESDVDGISAQSLLRDLYDKQIISSDEYQRAIIALILLNYSFISITSDDIFLVLNSPAVYSEIARNKVLKTLEGPTCSDVSAIRIAAEAIHIIWRKISHAESRRTMTIQVLEAVVSGREIAPTLALIERLLWRLFFWQPLHRALLYRDIQDWHDKIASDPPPGS